MSLNSRNRAADGSNRWQIGSGDEVADAGLEPRPPVAKIGNQGFLELNVVIAQSVSKLKLWACSCSATTTVAFASFAANLCRVWIHGDAVKSLR